MKNRPDITFITPTYNSEKHLEKTLKSIFRQDFENYEYIIVDGESSDKTLEIIEKYMSQIDILISEKDLSMYDAINKAIKLSKGKLIKIINSDDYLLENCVKEAVQKYQKSDNKKIIIDGYLKAINEDGSFKSVWTNEQKIINNYDVFNHPSWFVPKKVYDEFGLYSTDYDICSDYEYYLRLKKNDVQFQTIKRPIVAFRMGGISYNLDSMPEMVKINLKYFPAFKAYPDYYKQYFFKVLQIIYNKAREKFPFIIPILDSLRKINLAKLL